MTQASEVELLYITEQFVAAQEAGQYPRVADYIRRYPQYTDEIAAFVTYYYAMEADLPRTDVTVPSLSADSLEALKRGWAQAEDLSADDSITLLTLTRYQHGSLPRLAEALDLSIDLVEQLTSRQLDPATFPYELVRRFAQALAQPIDKVRNALGVVDVQKKQMVAELPLSYALPPRQRFCQAIAASSQLSGAQKERWQLILECEGLWL